MTRISSGTWTWGDGTTPTGDPVFTLLLRSHGSREPSAYRLGARHRGQDREATRDFLLSRERYLRRLKADNGE